MRGRDAHGLPLSAIAGQCFRGLTRRLGQSGRVLPLCAAACCCGACAANGNAGIKRKEGHLVDALALRGDEGRGTLRKARGRCERSVIPGSPNGATHPASGYPDLNS